MARTRLDRLDIVYKTVFNRYLDFLYQPSGLQLLFILDAYKNDIWKLPLVAFCNRADIEHDMEIEPFLRSLVRFLYVARLSGMSTEAVQGEMFMATGYIQSGKEYIFNAPQVTDLTKPIRGRSFRLGLCALLEHLRQKDLIVQGELDGYVAPLRWCGKTGYILPRNWRTWTHMTTYEGKVSRVPWVADEAKELMHTLGNVCLYDMEGGTTCITEMAPLMYTFDDYYQERVQCAKNSNCITLREIGVDAHDTWTPAACRCRSEKSAVRLKVFFNDFV